jgi:hypothetical protein
MVIAFEPKTKGEEVEGVRGRGYIMDYSLQPPNIFGPKDPSNATNNQPMKPTSRKAEQQSSS